MSQGKTLPQNNQIDQTSTEKKRLFALYEYSPYIFQSTKNVNTAQKAEICLYNKKSEL